MASSLEQMSERFASAIQDTLDGVLPGGHSVISRRLPEVPDRCVVQPAGTSTEARRVPLDVDRVHLADVSLRFFLTLDRSSAYLKTVRSEFALHSVLDRAPLLRLDYDAAMRSAPVSHWQVHAERGAISQLLARAHARDPRRVPSPHALSSLHLPVGGERFRPCLEDLLQFVVEECGVDHNDGWRAHVEAGRRLWRLRQLGSAVRDVPGEAARVLGDLGWTVQPPPEVGPGAERDRFVVW